MALENKESRLERWKPRLKAYPIVAATVGLPIAMVVAIPVSLYIAPIVGVLGYAYMIGFHTDATLEKTKKTYHTLKDSFKVVLKDVFTLGGILDRKLYIKPSAEATPAAPEASSKVAAASKPVFNGASNVTKLKPAPAAAKPATAPKVAGMK